ncbi:hypothetical protein Poly24_22460 [Rosistilla carotiformis]|uniref:SMP-30/Gluconolaconase/LRE-like region n=1 Tax=Rosistilla carotiformis TaxID=2528017 RepID=A0A518JSL5_9BACT|nr:hypothetical protein [Rosistilla carotiformis]QDV68536.1 hypothetical protein Poly24_22460 [Rosistilla carotiformis]
MKLAPIAFLMILAAVVAPGLSAADTTPAAKPASTFPIQVDCEGTYPHHLQGVCTDGDAIYWSFTTTLVKTDLDGKVTAKIPVANHHGDLCVDQGKIYVAVNLGRFNDPKGNADSWVYVYDASDLKEIARHETQEVFHGAGGVGVRDGNFYVVSGLPADLEENYVYQYDADFTFVKKHVVSSGQTFLGIQSAAFAHDRWWFGCYGSPAETLVTDANFKMIGRYKFNCSLGIEKLPGGELLVGSGRCSKGTGCTGRVTRAVPDAANGLKLLQTK